MTSEQIAVDYDSQLRAQLRETFAVLQQAADAGVDIVPLILEEMGAAGVELPLALQMLAGSDGG